jgi:hypothetical protein
MVSGEQHGQSKRERALLSNNKKIVGIKWPKRKI